MPNGNGKKPEKKNNIGKWNKGASKTAEELLKKHYNKHGEEVGANSIEQYLRKAEEFARNLKGSRKVQNIKGFTEGGNEIL